MAKVQNASRVLKPRRGLGGVRSLDFALGVPLVFATGLVRPQRPFPKNVRRLVLLQTAAIGDTVLMSGVTRDLRNRFPDSEIAVFAGPSCLAADATVAGNRGEPSGESRLMVRGHDFHEPGGHLGNVG